MSQKLGFGQRINRWLDEPEGETFKDGKWRFWFPMLIGFGLLNAILTAMVFGSGAALQTYLGGMMLPIGGLLALLFLGKFLYDDSSYPKMNRDVAAFDSITLTFVIDHFCFLPWIQVHKWALQSRETEYRSALVAY